MAAYVEEITHPYTGELISLEADSEQEMSTMVAREFERAAAAHGGTDWMV